MIHIFIFGGSQILRQSDQKKKKKYPAQKSQTSYSEIQLGKKLYQAQKFQSS